MVLAGVDRVLRVLCMIIGILQYCEAQEVCRAVISLFYGFLWYTTNPPCEETLLAFAGRTEGIGIWSLLVRLS